jgi:hypothetical protein
LSITLFTAISFDQLCDSFSPPYCIFRTI